MPLYKINDNWVVWKYEWYLNIEIICFIITCVNIILLNIFFNEVKIERASQPNSAKFICPHHSVRLLIGKNFTALVFYSRHLFSKK